MPLSKLDTEFEFQITENLLHVTVQHLPGESGIRSQHNRTGLTCLGQGIAEGLDVPLAEIYGVVTFYAQFSLNPKGKYEIGVCLGTACYVKGSQNVLDKFGEILNIKCGETTEDGLFTLDGLRCIGACGIAPAISINGKVYPKVQLSEVAHIITEYSSKEM